jgi:hypothetical protein
MNARLILFSNESKHLGCSPELKLERNSNSEYEYPMNTNLKWVKSAVTHKANVCR